MLKSISIAVTITIVAAGSYALSHNLESINYLSFWGVVYSIPFIFLCIFPIFMVPHFLKPHYRISFSILMIILICYICYRFSLADDPLRNQECIRISIISFVCIVANYLISIYLRTDRIMDVSDNASQE